MLARITCTEGLIYTSTRKNLYRLKLASEVGFEVRLRNNDLLRELLFTFATTRAWDKEFVPPTRLEPRYPRISTIDSSDLGA